MSKRSAIKDVNESKLKLKKEIKVFDILYSYIVELLVLYLVQNRYSLRLIGLVIL